MAQLFNVKRDVTELLYALPACHVVNTCSFNLQQVQAVEVLEGVLADAGDFVGIQQSADTIQNTHIVHQTTEQNSHVEHKTNTQLNI